VKPQESGIGELVKPKAAQPAPDMSFDALGVGRGGQRVEVQPAKPATPSGESAPEMTFAAPLEVPKDTSGHEPAPQAPAAANAKPEPAANPEAAVPARIQGFQKEGLHVVLFAAGSDGPGYDGIVIERVAFKSKRPTAKPATATPATPAPAASPAPAPPAATPAPAPPAAPNATPAPNSH